MNTYDDPAVLQAIKAELQRESIRRLTADELAGFIVEHYVATPERAAAIVARMERTKAMLCVANLEQYVWLLDPR